MLGMFLVLFVFVVWASVPGKTLAAQYETGFVVKSVKVPSIFVSRLPLTSGSYKLVIKYPAGGYNTSVANLYNLKIGESRYTTSKFIRIHLKPQPLVPSRPQPQPQPQLQHQPQQQQITGLSVDERRMVDLVNQERTRAGLPELKVNPELVLVAHLKAAEMVKNNYFSHASPTYGTPFEMMKQFGISYRTAGENLAGAPSVDLAHQNLMNSPGHRANILNGAFKEIGVGVVDVGARHAGVVDVGARHAVPLPYGKIFVQMFIG
jgi:uncharacterized YkwD family protein